MKRAAALSTQRTLTTGSLAFVATLLSASTASAVGDPGLRWETIETPHFRVHAPNTVAPIADRVARLAESTHQRLVPLLGYEPKSITEIVLTDDTDSANGSATALPFNTVRLYVTAPEDLSTLGDYDDWMLTLVTHEYTHILHIDNISGIPSIVNAILGKTYAPNQIQPRWVIEGLAVLEETHNTSGGRLRSALWDMYLRADVLDDNLASLDVMSASPLRWPQGNIWYLYGSRFLSFIVDVYGPATMTAISADYGGTLIPYGINRSIRRATGHTYEELYDGFKDNLKLRYGAQMRAVEARGLREGKRLTSHGRNVLYPRFVPRNARKGDAEELVYYRDDFNAREGLYRLTLDAKQNVAEDKLWARTRSSTPSSFSPKGELYFASTTPWKIVYNRGDLFRVEQGKDATRGDEPWRAQLTKGLRASAPDVSPDGRHITFIVNTKSTTFLQIADLDAEGNIKNRRDLVPSARFEQAYTPRFSPDGRFVTYSAWTEGGYRDVRLVDVATGSFENITHDRAMDTNPVFSPDGSRIYFSSDRSGIPNIYVYERASRTLSQVTNVRTGALQPAVSADEKTLAYVGYTSKGFDLFAMPIERDRFLKAPDAPTDRPDRVAEPANIPLQHKPYSPLKTLAPRNYTISYAPGNYSQNALTIAAYGADVAGFHEVAASLTADFAAPAPSVNLGYSYGRLPVDLDMRFRYAVVPRSGLLVNNRTQSYDERGVGFSSGLTYRIPGEFTNQSLRLSYNVTSFHGDLRDIGENSNPWATPTRLPPKGILNSLRASWGMSNVETSLDAAGSFIRGYTLRLAAEHADKHTGSDYSLTSFEGDVAGYIPMPYPGKHSLALRVAGGIALGTYPRDGYYFVGGYNLETYNIIDQVSTGIYDGSFVLRGYEPGSASGRAYVLQNIEYRFPIAKPDRGLSTLPIYLRRLDGNLFVDYGGAFDNLDLDAITLFQNGSIINSPDLHTSIGLELWIGLTLGYYINPQLRLGYAYGLSRLAIPGGQAYFIASAAF